MSPPCPQSNLKGGLPEYQLRFRAGAMQANELRERLDNDTSCRSL